MLISAHHLQGLALGMGTMYVWWQAKVWTWSYGRGVTPLWWERKAGGEAVVATLKLGSPHAWHWSWNLTGEGLESLLLQNCRGREVLTPNKRKKMDGLMDVWNVFVSEGFFQFAQCSAWCNITKRVMAILCWIPSMITVISEMDAIISCSKWHWKQD